MTENESTDDLVAKVQLEAGRYRVGVRKGVLYTLAIEDQGVVDMGVDSDSGEPIQGRGKGFAQHVLVYQESSGGHTSIVPRLLVEVRIHSLTSHDAMV